MTPALLKSNMSFLHGTMLASEELLRRAIDKSDGELREYFARHLEEERGHLAMQAQDLARLGVDPIPTFPEAAKLAGAQYYYIEHENPALLLGYMAALEGNPLPLEYVDQLEAAYGPLTCLRHHAIHDRDHGPELRAQIAKLNGDRARVEAHEAWVKGELEFFVYPAIVRAAERFQ